MDRKQMVLALVTVVFAGAAIAAPFTAHMTADPYDSTPDGTPTPNSNNDGTPDLYEAVNRLLGTAHTANEGIDGLMLDGTSNPDALWFLGGGGGSVVLIGLTAGYQNTLGVYTDPGVGAQRTDLLGPYSGNGFLGDGTAADPYNATAFNTMGQFGFYLTSSGASLERFYSEPELNWDASVGIVDHMVTYSLPGLAGQTTYVDFGSGAELYTWNNPYLVGWEDVPLEGELVGDEDYDDMIYIFDARPSGLPDGGSTAALLLIATSIMALYRKRRG